MKLTIDKSGISLRKRLNIYDRLALEFSGILRRQHVRHVFVSGYVAILFGRARVSEDVDLLLEPLDAKRFTRLWKALISRFECHATDEPGDAFERYFSEGVALRFSRPGSPMPNVEMKRIKDAHDRRSLEGALSVRLNDRVVPISPLGLQIAYKLHLGSRKDLQDARYLYRTVGGMVDRTELLKTAHSLEVPGKRLRRVLRDVGDDE